MEIRVLKKWRKEGHALCVSCLFLKNDFCVYNPPQVVVIKKKITTMWPEIADLGSFCRFFEPNSLGSLSKKIGSF